SVFIYISISEFPFGIYCVYKYYTNMKYCEINIILNIL
ncbi:hypothetical protein, partial [Plasmodium yoelii yoelii]